MLPYAMFLQPRSDDTTKIVGLSTIEGSKTIATVCVIIVTLSMILRYWARLGIARVHGAEDWAMIVAYLFTVAELSLYIWATDLIIPVLHGEFVGVALLLNIAKAFGTLYAGSLMMLKISLGFFFLHLFQHIRSQRLTIYLIVGASTVIGVILMIMTIAGCQDESVIGSTSVACSVGGQRAAAILYKAFSVITFCGDFIFSAMACYALYPAQLPRLTKISACFLILLGSSGGVASVARFIYYVTPASNQLLHFLTLVDCLILEMSLGVIAANLAMTRPLFNKALVRLGVLSYTGATKYGQTAATNLPSTQGRKMRENIQDEELIFSEVRKDMTVVVVGGEGARLEEV